ncbi:MAG: hypothetical protein MZV70_75915 [Desulfobacterales bacterium]|nr:hypothetical protein [Desulfobacterales bacterium]
MSRPLRPAESHRHRPFRLAAPAGAPCKPGKIRDLQLWKTPCWCSALYETLFGAGPEEKTGEVLQPLFNTASVPNPILEPVRVRDSRRPSRCWQNCPGRRPPGTENDCGRMARTFELTRRSDHR